MNEQTITIQYTKTDLRRYGTFSNFRRSLGKKLLLILFPLSGILFLVTAILQDELESYLLFAGIFLLLYPIILYWTSIIRMDSIYKSGALIRVATDITFKEDHILAVNERANTTTKYTDIFMVYNTKHAIYLYLSKHQATILPKDGQQPDLIRNIELILKEQCKDKYKG